MPRLEALPSGTSVFIDASVFLGHFLNQAPACTTFLERVFSREVSGVTSVLALSEVRHGLLRAEVSARQGLPNRRALRFLRKHPEIIAQLTESRRALAALRRWPLRVVHLTGGHFWQACRLSERCGLLTHDALHVVALRAHGLHHLVALDPDFLRVPGLTVWMP